MVMPAISFGSVYNRITYPIGFQIYWQVLRPLINRWRQILDMPPESVQGPISSELRQCPPCLYGFSEHIIPRAPEWGKEINITGYWMLEEEEAWTPPEGLTRFLENGPTPVYVGFGSMASRSAAKTTQITLEALKLTGLRGVLLSGWGGIDLSNLPDTVYPLEYAPHEWLFPHMKAVVHHGGSGTTAIGLKSGKPSVLIPFFADQPYWGWHVQRLKVGPKPIPSTRLTAKRLAKALEEAVNTPELSRRAAALGNKLKREDGVGNAVKAMTRIMQMA
jgi:sterol 3beta-glucosyltransferase